VEQSGRIRVLIISSVQEADDFTSLATDILCCTCSAMTAGILPRQSHSVMHLYAACTIIVFEVVIGLAGRGQWLG